MLPKYFDRLPLVSNSPRSAKNFTVMAVQPNSSLQTRVHRSSANRPFPQKQQTNPQTEHTRPHRNTADSSTACCCASSRRRRTAWTWPKRMSAMSGKREQNDQKNRQPAHAATCSMAEQQVVGCDWRVARHNHGVIVSWILILGLAKGTIEDARLLPF